MRKLFFPLIFLLSILTLEAQTPKRAVLEDLLDMPAPPAAVLTGDAKAKEYPPAFYDKKTPPPDDAPIEDLLAYWERQNSSYSTLKYNVKPTAAVAQRILDACETQPEIIAGYLEILPADARLINLVKRIYQETATENIADYPRERLKEWLRFNSNDYSSSLLKEVQKVKDDKEYVTNQNELLALGRVDWEAAKPFVERLYNDASQPVSQTLARWVLYQHALDAGDASDADRYREELKKIVEDRAASDGKRDLAMDALMQTEEWEGRDDWYFSLLGDETLFDLRVNGQSYTGLTTLVMRTSPDKWIPQMIKLVGNPNRAVHRAAVRNLAVALEENRKDVVEALLPWLENPKWAEEIGGERRRLISAAAEVDLPESVPVLIRVLMNDEDDYFRSMAAQALVKYKNPQAIPALRFALSKEKSEGYRTNIIAALVACGGIPDDEQMAALESFAEMLAAPEGSDKFQGDADYDAEATLPLQTSIGKFLSTEEEPGDGLAARAIARLKILRRTNPPVAQALSDIMQKWRGRVIFAELARQISGGTANAEIVLNALAKREKLREKLPLDLSAMRGKSGLARGVAAVILEDKQEMLHILEDKDAEAKIAMLAGARLIRAQIPVGEVGAFLKDADKLLVLAAERYLESEDSAEARALVLAQHPNEAKILGAKTAFIPDKKKSFSETLLNELFASVNSTYYDEENFSDIEKQEENLRAETKANPDLKAVFAILPEAEAGQEIIRVYKDKITFSFYEDAARYWEKTLTAKEYENFYRFVIDRKIDNLATLGFCEEECLSGEFVMFSRNGGRRVFYNGYVPEILPIADLQKIFASFHTDEWTLHYRLSDKIKGLEVLLVDKNYAARAIWKNGADFRVLVEDKLKEAEIKTDLEEKEKAESSAEVDEDNPAQRQEIQTAQRNRREQMQYAHYVWQRIEDGKLGSACEKPLDWNYTFEELNAADESGEYERENYSEKANTTRAGNFEIYAGYVNVRGLWKFAEGQEPVLIKEGFYTRPVASADGKWIVVSKIDETGASQPGAVRLNLQTGKETKINLPPADEFYPIAFIASQNKFLLYRAKQEYSRIKNNPSPIAPAYYLLDAATGATQATSGEFRPLEEKGYRPLQPTGAPNEFWAAIYNEKTKATAIGRYDEKSFVFKPIVQIPDINLSSQDVAVDEKDAKVYFVYEGHLLALPIAK